jgi:hypothetical protein
MEALEMLHRIHMQMEYSYNHNATSVFFVIQNKAFVIRVWLHWR